MRDHAGFLFLYLNDSKVFERLYNYDKSFAEKFINAVKRAIEKLRRFFKENPTYARTEYGKALQEAMSKVENRVQELWDEAVAQGIRAENKNAATKGGIKYMARDFEGERLLLPFRDKEKIKEALNKTRDEILSRNMAVTIEDDTDSTIDYTDIKEGRNYIKSILKQSLGVDVQLGVDNHTLIARLTREGLNHASKNNNNKEKAALFNQFIKLAGSSIYSYSTVQDKMHSVASANIAEKSYWDSFLSVARFEGAYYNVVFSVRSIDSDVRGQIYDSWIKKEANASHGVGTQNESANELSNYGSQIASTNIISDNSQKINTPDKKSSDRFDTDYLSAVERGDMKTAQQMVDEAAERAFKNSKIRDDNGKLIKVYHGTEGDFTVFDKTKGRANMDIQGMFFSPWELDAQGYGSNVRAFYLNITNPADESTGYKALNSHKGENNAGVKAREDLVRMGYDGVNNSDEEYIAFDSSQIKSADPVTYDDDGNVIPLSERFNEEQEDIRYQDRYNEYDDLFDMGEDLFEDDSKREIFDEMIEKYPYEALALSATPKKSKTAMRSFLSA